MTSGGKIESGDLVSGSGFVIAMNAFYNRFKETINLPRTYGNETASKGYVHEEHHHYKKWITGGGTIRGSSILTIPTSWYKTLDTVTIGKPTGIVKISVLYKNLSVILDCFLYVRYIHAMWYHTHSGSKWLVAQRYGYQNINKEPIQKPDVPESIKPGDLISARDFNSKLDDVYNSWLQSIANAGTVTYSTFTCHYACHSNHTNRARR